jgi:hypothetical protein
MRGQVLADGGIDQNLETEKGVELSAWVLLDAQ